MEEVGWDGLVAYSFSRTRPSFIGLDHTRWVSFYTVLVGEEPYTLNSCRCPRIVVGDVNWGFIVDGCRQLVRV